jgi:hypothetical protein
MSSLAHFAAAGVFVAMLPTGWYWASRLAGAGSATRVALAPGFGVAAWCIPLGLSAATGTFAPTFAGLVGWCVALIALVALGAAAVGRFSRALRSRENSSLAFLCLIAGALYLGFPSETPFGFRDEGLYTLGALALARSGSLTFAYPPGIELAPELFAAFVMQVPFYVPGVYATPQGLTFQFSPLLPAWIAQLQASVGNAGLYRVNGIFAVLAIPIFYALARRFMKVPIASACSVLFALNPAQVWNVRINLSEPLTQILLLTGLLLVCDAIRRGSRGRTAAAATVFGVAAFLRLDAVLVPVLVLSAAIAVQFGLRTRGAVAARRLAVAAVLIAAAQSVGIGLLWLFTGPYVQVNAGTLAKAAAGGLALAVVFIALRQRSVVKLGTTTLRNRVAIGCAVLISMAFAYAAWVRPHFGPFAIIDLPGSTLHGVRDFREAALPNLAAYLTWPVTVLALVGACVGISRTLRGRGNASVASITVMGTAGAAVYLMDPQVSPDHFWWVRRFVPLVIPLAILLAGCAVQAILARLRLRSGVALAVSLVPAAAFAALYVQRETLLVRESRGVTAAVREFEASLPPGPILTRDADGLATTLLVGFGRPVLPLRGAASATPSARAFLATCPAEGCTLLAGTNAAPLGLAVVPVREVVFARTVIAPTTRPLPRETKRDDVRIEMSRIPRLPRDAAGNR